MRLAIGSDHAGFELKEVIRDALVSEGFDVEDLGTHYPTPSDYPDFARAVGEAVASGRADFGVLVCGTGIGMSIAANKVRGVRAALCTSEWFAQMARRHNNANVICLPARAMEPSDATRIVRVFLSTPFDGDTPRGARHLRRVQKIAQIEGEGR